MEKWLEKFPTDLQQKIAEVDKMIAPKLQEIDEIVLYNQQRVLDLFRKYHVAEEDLVGSTGYGYNDVGRDKLEQIFADYFKCEDALVRPQIVSGTHAISTALFASLHPNDTLYYITGMPYDTIQQVIGIVGDNPGSMKEYGIGFEYTPLTNSGKVDFPAVKEKLLNDPTIKVVAIQRSRGYAVRDSFTVKEIEEMTNFVKKINPNITVFIDNCYGEFTEIEEPTFHGADLIAGSMFKNAGAGVAKSGAFLVGNHELIMRAASRLFAPGPGKGEGATYGYQRDFYRGFFLAPHVTGEAIKGSIYTAALLGKMGAEVSPKWDAKRTDLVQTVIFHKQEPMIKFCASIQHYSPLNSFVDPIPSEMDNYEDKVIMASGSFVEGSTIELSSDGPLRDPYALYIQGGLSYAHVKIAISNAVNETYYN
ncbi:aminotransferase class I/II-fold pyridoxal phosphate-dependent enzyme [Ligilactobacillus cholophilus]|uniref:methionine gamma-lyase family protein n=1 Tax=Ligilactobacillus cholophilus TaxID=3050131 RepID=UPI0025B20DBB|nr:methionine gamma-lyase family protein [Ligilactobacillus cholophilus]